MVDSFNNKNINPPEISDDYKPPNNLIPIILIVDDDEDSRSMLRTLLELWKYLVIEAADGVEAVKIAEKTCPDLILMDVKLPRLDGFATTHLIRQSAKTANVPIVFLSGCSETTYKKKAAAVGGNEYLTKPINFDELEIILGKYICVPQKVSI